MEETKQRVKRLLRDNAVVVVAILLFVVVLLALVGARYGSLYSIRNIANLNPLITTNNDQLVAVNVNGVIKIIKDDDGVVTNDEKKIAVENESRSKSGAIGAGSSTGGNSQSQQPGSSSSSPYTPPDKSPPIETPKVPVFSVSVESISQTGRSEPYDTRVAGLSYTCKNLRNIDTQIKVTGSSGTVKIQWKIGDRIAKTSDEIVLASGATQTVLTEIISPVEGRQAFHDFRVTAEIINVANSAIIGSGTSGDFGHRCLS